MRFSEPGLADGLQRHQGRKLRFDRVLDTERKKPPFFHRIRNGKKAVFLSRGRSSGATPQHEGFRPSPPIDSVAKMKRPVCKRKRGVFTARHSGLTTSQTPEAL